MMMLLSGCTSGGSADRSQGSSTTSRSADAGGPSCGAVRGRSVGCWDATAAPTTSSTTSETTSATPASRACRVSDLQVRLGSSQGLGGTNYTPLIFRNRSSSRCSLTGHPKVSFLDRSARVIGQAAPTPLIDPPVTPGPGEVAIADIGVGSQSLGDCRPVTPATLRVVLPGGGAVSVAAGSFRFCPSQNPGIHEFQGPYEGG
jgi:uncharacterized protein DUF4232